VPRPCPNPKSAFPREAPTPATTMATTQMGTSI